MALETGAKIGLGVVLAGAVGYLVFSDTGEGVLDHVEADQVVAAPDQYQGREIKVYGIVVEGSIKQKKGQNADYLFEIEHNGKRLKVHFTDMVPDTFQEGGEVQLTGHLNAAGDTIESNEMSAKCPSKYEEEQGQLRS
jgi:cytochrome c-type biogenesis protein CcmE